MSDCERFDEFLEFVPRDALSGSLGGTDRLERVELSVDVVDDDDDDEETEEKEDFCDLPVDGAVVTAPSPIVSSFVAVDDAAVVDDSAFEQLWLEFSVPDLVVEHSLHVWATARTLADVSVVERLFAPVWLSTLRYEVAVDQTTEYTDDACLLASASFECDQALLFELLTLRGFTTARTLRLPMLPVESVPNYASQATTSSASALWRVRKITSELGARLARVQRRPPDAATLLTDVLPLSAESAAAGDEAPPELTGRRDTTLGECAAARVQRRLLGAAAAAATHVTLKSASHRLLWLPVFVAQAGGAPALVSGLHGVVAGRRATVAAASSSSAASEGVLGTLINLFSRLQA